MNWLKKIITDCDTGLNRCMGTPHSSINTENLSMPTMLPGPYLTAAVIDQSGSMAYKDFRPSRIEAGKEAIIAFAAKRAMLSPKDQLTIIGFNTDANVYLPWSSVCDCQAISRALCQIEADGGTELAQGLMAAQLMILTAVNPGYKLRILLLTDGHGGDPIELAEYVKAHGILIQVIGIGGGRLDVNEIVLKAVATTDSSGFIHYWFIKDSQSLVEHYEKLSTGIAFRRT